jgi:hypothetical protein
MKGPWGAGRSPRAVAAAIERRANRHTQEIAYPSELEVQSRGIGRTRIVLVSGRMIAAMKAPNATL